MYGIVFFFIIEPFSEFGANFTSFKTILGKD